MPKRVKHRPSDVNQLARHLVDLSTFEPSVVPEADATAPFSISNYLAEIGRKGGKIGGKRRLKTLTAAERQKIASNAAKARWKKAQKNDER